MPAKRNLTISEAAELTGLSRKALARRVERGSIRSVLRSGRRLIPRSELIRVGLIPAEGYRGVDRMTDAALLGSVAVSDEPGGEQSLLEVLVRELLDRVQRQAGELAQYKALTAEAESLRLQRELADLRLRLVALEGGSGQPALESGPSESAQAALGGQAEQGASLPSASAAHIWLPPHAASERTNFRGEDLPPPVPVGAGGSTTSRVLRLAGEMIFIGVVALFAWLAGLGPVLSVVAVGAAWLLAATFEFVRWRS